MANLINEDYFVRDISIPTGTPDEVARLDSEIEKYEKEVLLKVLGYDLYYEFINNPIEQRFLDIRNGKEFVFDLCGKTIKRKYVGLTNSQKESLIAYYVYFYITRDRVSFTSSTGEINPDNENSNQISPYGKMVSAWNNYVEMAGDLTCTRYNDPYFLDYFYKLEISSYMHVNDHPSLYNFLLANKEVYPEWEFDPCEKISIFGI